MYDGIVVTGHSKGGNLAQYVTVTNEELIKECVSYDGQGFGDDFVRRYCSDIEKAAPKIKSVSAYNDFVNILLTCIAGTTVYVANDASAAGAHSPTTLLTCNSFDESGCITSVTSQGMVAKELDALTDMIVKALGPLSDREKGTLCSIAGRAVSSALCAPKGEIVNECVAPTLGLAAALAVKSLMPADPDAAIKSPAFSVTHIDTFSCLRVADDLIAQRRGIERVIAGVERVRGEIANGITTGMIAERALESVCNELSDISNMIYGTAQTVEGAARIYADAESRIMDLLRGS